MSQLHDDFDTNLYVRLWPGQSGLISISPTLVLSEVDSGRSSDAARLCPDVTFVGHMSLTSAHSTILSTLTQTWAVWISILTQL